MSVYLSIRGAENVTKGRAGSKSVRRGTRLTVKEVVSSKRRLKEHFL